MFLGLLKGNRFFMFKKLCWSLAIIFTSTAQAMLIDWSGGYRLEWIEINKPGLGSNAICDSAGNIGSCRKSYGLNYLYLTPKIIAADGVNIVSRFEVLQPSSVTYRNAQIGQIFGTGVNSSTGIASDSNVLLTQQESTGIRVSQLYLNINQEYGAFIAGRAPLEFGLGMTYHAGKGLYDHWADIHDLVAYKFIIGNFSMMPIFGRVRDADIGQGQTMQNEGIQMMYDSAESGSSIGLMIDNRKSDGPTNDVVAAVGGSTGVRGGDLRMQRMNFVLGREWEEFNFKLEVGSVTGDTGVTKGTDQVKFNAYGFAAEMNFPRKDSKIQYGLKLGIASGDDPNSKDFEGYQFHRNYDVAFMLFNHRLGQADFLTTNVIKNTGMGLANSMDDEALSNVAYISPTISQAVSDKIDIAHRFTYAQLMSSPTLSNTISKDLGFEYDLEVTYKHTDKIQWLNQFGILMPGAAFKNGSSNFETDMNFGLASKAAISF